MDSEREKPLKYKIDGQTAIIQEYAAIVDSLKNELQSCKAEQATLRSELETLQNDSKSIANTARQHFSQTQIEDTGGGDPASAEMIANLRKRLAIMQMEKDSVFQLWQMALKAVDILEEELKSCREDGKGTKYYEEQVNSVRETYSDAIKALETKLLQAKENFLKHQSIWESSREKQSSLIQEKNDLAQEFKAFREEVHKKDQMAQRVVESLRAELSSAKLHRQQLIEQQSERDAKLKEAQRFAAAIMAKDSETKSKVSEAIVLVESAVQEKEQALQREALAVEEKMRMERQLAEIGTEYSASLEQEISKVKDSYERNIKKCLLDMKELKVEVQQKATLLDRAQRECRLVEEELDKVRNDSVDVLHRSNSKVLSLEQRLQEMEFKLQVCEGSGATKELEQQIVQLEKKLSASSDQMKRLQNETSRETEERVREADERTKEAVERNASLERRLARALDEREAMVAELRSVRTTFEWEMKRKDQERRVLETRMRELQEDLRTASRRVEETVARGDLLDRQIHVLEFDLEKKCDGQKKMNETERCCKTEMMEQMRTLQDRCDKRTRELTQHVETHQKLSKKWKEEAKTLTSSFQKRLKELRGKVSSLRKENDELNRELLSCRQQLAQCREKIVHRYDQGDTLR